MQKIKLTVVLDQDVCDRLDISAGRYSLTKNNIIAAAACELSHVEPERLWYVISSFAPDKGQPAVRIPGAKRKPRTKPDAAGR